MYIPSAFAETSPDVLESFIRENSFGTLITAQAAAGLCGTPLPFLFAPDGAGGGTLRAHMARQNQQWHALQPETEVLVIFQGPHAYISPRWYLAKNAVPTWNYAAVHAYGRPRLITDHAATRQILLDTVTAYEGTGPGAWSAANLPAEYMDQMQAAIVAFTIDITRLEGKFKLNQNRPAADRASVVKALQAAGGENAQAIAALMQAGLLKKEGAGQG